MYILQNRVVVKVGVKGQFMFLRYFIRIEDVEFIFGWIFVNVFLGNNLFKCWRIWWWFIIILIFLRLVFLRMVRLLFGWQLMRVRKGIFFILYDFCEILVSLILSRFMKVLFLWWVILLLWKIFVLNLRVWVIVVRVVVFVIEFGFGLLCIIIFSVLVDFLSFFNFLRRRFRFFFFY